MPLKDGGGGSTRHTFLGGREGGIALPFPGTVVYLGHAVCGQQSPLSVTSGKHHQRGVSPRRFQIMK